MTAKVCKRGAIRVDGKCRPSSDIGKKHGFLYDKKELKKSNISFKSLGGPWLEGYIGSIGYYGGKYFQARIFDTPSKYGLKRGRISNLIILDGLRGREDVKNIYDYDGGLTSSTKKGRELAEKIRETFPVIKNR